MCSKDGTKTISEYMATTKGYLGDKISYKTEKRSVAKNIISIVLSSPNVRPTVICIIKDEKEVLWHPNIRQNHKRLKSRSRTGTEIKIVFSNSLFPVLFLSSCDQFVYSSIVKRAFHIRLIWSLNVFAAMRSEIFSQHV